MSLQIFLKELLCPDLISSEGIFYRKCFKKKNHNGVFKSKSEVNLIATALNLYILLKRPNYVCSMYSLLKLFAKIIGIGCCNLILSGFSVKYQ